MSLSRHHLDPGIAKVSIKLPLDVLLKKLATTVSLGVFQVLWLDIKSSIHDFLVASTTFVKKIMPRESLPSRGHLCNAFKFPVAYLGM